jgi:phosphoserine phosphatase
MRQYPTGRHSSLVFWVDFGHSGDVKEKTACFDIDRTLTRDLVFVPLIQDEYKVGLLNEGSFNRIIDILAAYKRGDLTYEDTVEQACRLHATGLKGRRYDDVKRHASDLFVSREAALFRTFARPAFELLRMDHELIIVTAEPQYVGEAVKDQFALDGVVSSVYAVKDGAFTGTVQRSLAHRSQKVAVLGAMTIDYAFGDSEGDIDMLAAAKHPVCIDPTPGLRELALERGWVISDGEHDELIGMIRDKTTGE